MFGHFHLRFFVGVLGLVAFASGCGGRGEKADPKSGASAVEAVEAIKRVDEAKLKPMLAENPLPPMDDGRLEVTLPLGWNSNSGPVGFVALFKKENASGKLPRILIKAEDVEAELKTATAENLPEFKTWMEKFLIERDEHFKAKVLEQVKPMLLGGNPCVRYVLKANIDGVAAERQVLHTLHEGRLYSVFLDVEARDLADFRDQGYAVLASLKFLAPSPAPPAVEPPVAAPPAVVPPEKTPPPEAPPAAAPAPVNP